MTRMPWNVTHVWRSEMVINGDWLSKITIELDDGTKLALDHSLSDYKELAVKIQYHASLHLLPKKQADWAAGRVEFGLINLRRDGICIQYGISVFYKKEAVAWSDLAHWGVWNGNLVLVSAVKKPMIFWPLGGIPDSRILLVMLEAVTGMRATPAAVLEKLMS